MDTSAPDLHSLAARMERLEKQNRRIKLVCSALVLAPVLAIVACQSRLTSVIDAQRFVLRDNQGKVRAEIAMTYDFGPNGNPVFRLLDENGKELTTLGAGVLNISDGKGKRGVLLDDHLQFTSSAGATVRLDGGEGRESLWLFGHGEGGGKIFLNATSPTVELADGNGFQADLGSNQLVTTRTGQHTTTSAASVVLSGKDGKVLWSAP